MNEIKSRSNEESLDLFADLLEPVAEILADAEVKEAFESKKIRGVKVAIKNHKAEVVQILALIDGIPVEEYKVNVFTLPLKLLELLNKPEVAELFQSQGQMKVAATSGSATVNTEDGVQ